MSSICHIQREGRSLSTPFVWAIALLCIAAPASGASAGTAALEELGCGGCHQLAPPAAAERNVESYAARKGPELFYAGSKFRPEWLRSWLAKPTPIRPAGLHPAQHTRSSEAGDVVASPPAAHPPVSADRLDSVVAELIALEWGRELLPSAPAARAPVPRALAELNFTKFKGCGSCHRTVADAAPLSGPDLFDAHLRMREDFLASFIANPGAWDPVAPMPDYGLEPAEVGKLVEYLRLLGERGR